MGATSSCPRMDAPPMRRSRALDAIRLDAWRSGNFDQNLFDIPEAMGMAPQRPTSSILSIFGVHSKGPIT